MPLTWPSEIVRDEPTIAEWGPAASNRIIDFHGDPVRARLCVFSDGNHHMAFLDALRAFYQKYPDVEDIFYATTPPHPIVKILREGALRLGNLTLSVKPHVFICPPAVLDRLQTDGFINSHEHLARNRGSALLTAHGNPKNIHTIKDLMRPEVRLFISNPDTEAVSHDGYRETLEAMAAGAGLDAAAFCSAVFNETTCYGQCIHHREAPEAIAAHRADVAVVYDHLALRYVRIFPDRFERISWEAVTDRPPPHPENKTADIHMGIVGDGGQWGRRLVDFLKSPKVADIYAGHGLDHRLALDSAASD